MYARLTALVARGIVYCGNGLHVTHEQRGIARLHLAVGRMDMPSFSDFQKLISP